MICPICKQKGIRCVSPYYYKGTTVEACGDCSKRLKLTPMNVKYKKDGGVRYPIWKVKIPAINE